MTADERRKYLRLARGGYDYITLMRKGGQIKRFHTENIIGEETVGHHTYGVICWVLALTERSASRDLMLAALYHDTDEQMFGDLPGPSKWNSRTMDEIVEVYRNSFREEHRLHILLTEEEHLTLRWADKMDLLMSCYDQQRLGNTRGIEIGRKVVTKLESMDKHPVGSEMLHMFIMRHQEYMSDQLLRGEYYDT